MPGMPNRTTVMTAAAALLAALASAPNRCPALEPAAPTAENPKVHCLNEPKLAYVDQQGRTPFDPKIVMGTPFSRGRAVVRLAGGEQAIIDGRGEVLVTLKDLDVRDGLVDGYALFLKDGKYGLISDDGKISAEPRFRTLQSLSEGLAVYQDDDGKWGYVDARGKVVVKARYRRALAFQGGLAEVGMADGTELCGLVNAEGRELVPPTQYRAYPLGGGFGAVWPRREGKMSLIDASGKWIARDKFEDFEDFSEGTIPAAISFEEKTRQGPLLITSQKKLWGFLDKQGNWTIKPQFLAARGFAGGLAPVSTGAAWGYINPQGAMVIPPQFSVAYGFSEGRAVIKVGDPRQDVCGVIDTRGALVVPCRYSEVGACTNGFHRAFTDKIDAVLNSSGQAIWQKNKP